MVARNNSFQGRQTAGNAKAQTPALTVGRRHNFDLRPRVTLERFSPGISRHELSYPQPLTVDDVGIHAWLIERQALVNRERRGWRARLKRFFRS